MHTSRRSILLSSLALALRSVPVLATAADAPARDLAAIESAHGGRLGVFAVDLTGTRPPLAWRADERFALCSTFKLPLAAMVLMAADRGVIDLDEAVPFGKEDLVPYAPVVEKHLAQGSLTIRELAAAAQITSDNVAANLLLQRVGGPVGMTRWLRRQGDRESRLDRIEPELNLVLSGDPRDTTTPAAMAALIATLFSADALSDLSRQQLTNWMVDTSTGLNRLRAGFPKDWVAGNKTGTGIHPSMSNKYNDVAVVWQKGTARFIVTAYYEADKHYPQMRSEDVAILAAVGGVAARWATA